MFYSASWNEGMCYSDWQAPTPYDLSVSGCIYETKVRYRKFNVVIASYVILEISTTFHLKCLTTWNEFIGSSDYASFISFSERPSLI